MPTDKTNKQEEIIALLNTLQKLPPTIARSHYILGRTLYNKATMKITKCWNKQLVANRNLQLNNNY